jgi:hypothetical protein
MQVGTTLLPSLLPMTACWRPSRADLRPGSQVDAVGTRDRDHVADSGRPDAVSDVQRERLAERFMRSVKDECLGRVVPCGEPHLHWMLAQFTEHYHDERNHQGLGNELINPVLRGTPVAFVVASESAGCSTTTIAQHDAMRLVRSPGRRTGGTLRVDVSNINRTVPLLIVNRSTRCL